MTETTTPGPNPAHPDRVTPERLRLLHDYLAVAALAVSTRAAGGTLFLPENAGVRERSQRGVVIAVGPGEFTDAGTLLPMSIAAGDLVFFGKYAGTEEDFGGRTLLVMRETECRVSVPAGQFTVVDHPDNPKLNHLVEDYCEACHGDPDAEARERLARDREALVARTSPETVQAAGGSADLPELPPRVLEPAERRACPGVGGESCLFMQTLNGTAWVGARCGHQHPAAFVGGHD